MSAILQSKIKEAREKKMADERQHVHHQSRIDKDSVHKIIEIPINVNTFSQEKIEELALYTEGVKCGFYKNPAYAYIFEDGQVLLAPEEFDIKVKNCPFSVPQTESKNDFYQKEKKRTPVEERYKTSRGLLATGKIENWMILSVYSLIQSRKTIISLNKVDGEYFTMVAPFKGGRVYNNFLATKVKDRAKILVENCPYRYFLTLTCDPKKYDNNRIKAWESWKRELSEFLRYMTRTFDVMYQCVLESTANGYPHAHIIIYSKKGLFSEKKPKDSNKPIRTGEVVRWITEHSPAKIFHLTHTKQGNIEYYLVKYIVKVYNAEEDENKVRPDKLKGDEKKGMLTNIMQVITGTRGYLCNTEKKLKKYLFGDSGKKTQAQENVQSEEIEESEIERIIRENDNSSEALDIFFKHLARRANSLIGFRINSPATCGKIIYMIPNSHLQYVPKKERGRIVGKKPSFLSDRRCKKILTCCKGCNLMDFREKYLDYRQEKDYTIEDRVYLTYDELAELNIRLYKEKQLKEVERKEELKAKLGIDELWEEAAERIRYEWKKRQAKLEN